MRARQRERHRNGHSVSLTSLCQDNLHHRVFSNLLISGRNAQRKQASPVFDRRVPAWRCQDFLHFCAKWRPNSGHGFSGYSNSLIH